jgi:hypothetical protein
MLNDHPHMGREWIEARPGSSVSRVTREGCTHPCQRLDQAASALLLDKAAPRYILHEPMNVEFLLVHIAPRQRIVGEIGKSLNEIIARNIGHRHFKQKVRYRLGPKPCEPLQQTTARRRELICGCLPGNCNRARIFRDPFI